MVLSKGEGGYDFEGFKSTVAWFMDAIFQFYTAQWPVVFVLVLVLRRLGMSKKNKIPF